MPDPYNPFDWDRYLYSRNNPLIYSDPSGHTPLLITAAIGSVIGFAANYTIQTYSNIQNGMNLSEAASWSNINKQELAVATVGGFVGGLTLGLASAAIGAVGLTSGLSTAASAVVGGAVSNVTAGQAEALTNAAIDQVTANTTFEVTPNGQHLINFSINPGQFISDAKKYGFGNQNTMIHDAVVGGVVGIASTGFQGIAAEAGTPSSLLLNGQAAPWIRPVSRAIDYAADTFKEYEKKY